MIRLHFNAAAARPIPSPALERALRVLLGREGVANAEISVTFTGDEAISALHRRHLGRPGPTDVIAFALHGPGDDPLGDIYIGHDQAVRQAASLGIPEEEELVRLAIHGALHLLGHTHPEGSGRETSGMYRVQEAVLREALESPGTVGPPANARPAGPSATAGSPAVAASPGRVGPPASAGSPAHGGSSASARPAEPRRTAGP